MLKTVELSTAKKTSGCAVTYRAGAADKFDTCPASCKLNPSGRGCGAGEIDHDYLDAVLNAKPKRGFSFGYSHFDPLFWAHKLRAGKTVLNYSADSLAAAYAVFSNKVAPVVVVVKESFWKNGKNAAIDRDDIPTPPVPVIRCPAEYNPAVNCRNCGAEKGPLCARLNRSFIVGFTAHGASKKQATTDDPGGCYAAGGNVALHWQATTETPDTGETDGEKLLRFARGLPPGSVLRHHVAGDIGRE